jgi:hypothetical protein
MNLKTLKEWFTNFGTVFSILGFFATIYLGIFYVPTWLQESQNERKKNAENEILQSVKELVFSDSTFSLNELPSLIRAKEITLKETFPLPLEDILTKTEESFMEDIFLPLTKRKELINKIEQIKKQLPKEVKTINQKSENKSWLSWFSIITSILSVILGVISGFIKFKADKDKDAEIQNELQELSSDTDLAEYGYEYEKNIESAIRKRQDLYIEEERTQDKGIDLVFSKADRKYFIEAKYLRKSKIGLNTFQRLTHYLKDKNGEAWLVYNTDLTPLVEEKIKEFNRQNSAIKINPIRLPNSSEFADKLNILLPE